MRAWVLALLPPLLWGCGGGAGEGGEPPAAMVEEGSEGRLRLVRLSNRSGGFVLEPAELRIQPGDRIRFLHTGRYPESVSFDTARLDAEQRAFLRERRATSGPLLTRPGESWDVDFGSAPEGTYEFYSIPHREQGMRGSIVVADAPEAVALTPFRSARRPAPGYWSAPLAS